MSDLNGPVGIVSTINDVGNQSASIADALLNIVYFGAFISVNLAVMNLLSHPCSGRRAHPVPGGVHRF